MNRLIRILMLLSLSFLLVSCGGGGGESGSGTVSVPVAVLSGDVYKLSGSFNLSSAAPAGYSPVSGTAVFTSTSGKVVRSASFSGNTFSISFYDSDFQLSGNTGLIPGKIRITYDEGTAESAVNLSKSTAGNSFEFRISKSASGVNSMIVLEKNETVSSSFKITLHYFDSTGNMTVPSAVSVHILENGKTFSMTDNTVISFSVPEAALIRENTVTAVFSSDQISTRKNLSVITDQEIVIIETGSEDAAVSKINGASAADIYRSFQLCMKDLAYNQSRQILSGKVFSAAEQDMANTSIALSYFFEKNFSRTLEYCNQITSFTSFSAALYASAAAVCAKTSSDFQKLNQLLDSHLPAVFSDGHGFSIKNYDMLRLRALCAFYSGDMVSAAGFMDQVKQLYDKNYPLSSYSDKLYQITHE